MSRRCDPVVSFLAGSCFRVWVVFGDRRDESSSFLQEFHCDPLKKELSFEKQCPIGSQGTFLVLLFPGP